MCKVTVIIPCYNAGKYLLETISSIKEQTFTNWEIIIVDDGSTDSETKNILLNIDKNEKIKLIYQENKGPAHARNTGIAHAKGKFILPLDADDKISPYYMEEAIPLFKNNNNLGIVYCRAQKFGKESGEWILPEYSARQMAFDNVIFVSAFFKKSDWELVGGFPTYARHGMEDYAFWLRIIRLGRDVYKINKILFYYRIQNVSRTISFSKNQDRIIETYANIFRDNIDFFYQNAEGIYQYRFEYEKKLRDNDIKTILKKIPLLYNIARIIWRKYKNFVKNL